SQSSRDPPYLHSFPTRRSSDLPVVVPHRLGESSDRPPEPADIVGAFGGIFRQAPARLLDEIAHHQVDEAANRFVNEARLFEPRRSEEHTSELQSLRHLVCRLLL